mmetsp:Transcript_65004/g.209396  ORF Transcript_65004/g.209396 Transcript_65004/m.209396 type:complete len:371 (+) Transcript_65004:129-1241(+)
MGRTPPLRGGRQRLAIKQRPHSALAPARLRGLGAGGLRVLRRLLRRDLRGGLRRHVHLQRRPLHRQLRQLLRVQADEVGGHQVAYGGCVLHLPERHAGPALHAGAVALPGLPRPASRGRRGRGLHGGGGRNRDDRGVRGDGAQHRRAQRELVGLLASGLGLLLAPHRRPGRGAPRGVVVQGVGLQDLRVHPAAGQASVDYGLGACGVAAPHQHGVGHDRGHLRGLLELQLIARHRTVVQRADHGAGHPAVLLRDVVLAGLPGHQHRAEAAEAHVRAPLPRVVHRHGVVGPELRALLVRAHQLDTDVGEQPDAVGPGVVLHALAVDVRGRQDGGGRPDAQLPVVPLHRRDGAAGDVEAAVRDVHRPRRQAV